MQDTKDISLSAHNGSQNAGTKERSLTDLFHRIKQVLPDEQELITFTPDTPVIEAFEIMRKNNISQVPVTEGVEVLGVFSYRSFANGMTCLPENERKDLSLPVEEFLEKLTFNVRIWKKQADGAWKLQVDVWNSSVPHEM
ncbi:CBS domain-containing protein [candidate division KSB1 bacterium]|nr:CBS domain-containing protein [candidate division KSB1 bacterium]